MNNNKQYIFICLKIKPTCKCSTDFPVIIECTCDAHKGT